jgi:hypothetical protein
VQLIAPTSSDERIELAAPIAAEDGPAALEQFVHSLRSAIS